MNEITRLTKKPIIEIKNLTKKYKDFYALDNVSLTIYEGERIGIIGANGAGKSTLVEIIAGIKTKTSGEIVYNFEENPKKAIGLQIQDTSFPDGLKLKDIIRFYCSCFNEKINSERIQKLLNFFDVNAFLDVWVGRLSGGQRQRVNALLTIITNPKVLIVDEMSTGLDITTKIELTKFINSYVDKTKKTYISISHSEAEIMETTNRIIIMENGKIISDTTIEKIGGYEGIRNYFNKRVRKENE